MNLIELPAHELAALIGEGEVSCREVMQAFLERIEAVNPTHNAIVSLRDGDELLQEADRCDLELVRDSIDDEPRSFLFGLPQAIKDILPAAGIRSTMGSPILKDFVPAADALMVQRMKAAGCIVIGKTNTPEFGLGSHTFNEVFGATRNAFDATKSAGGSSGGAAVALALRMLPVADGSDSMGSLRNPAGWNNVFGFRPSLGRIPAWPVQDAWVTHMGTEGPMARNVRDLALLLDVQAAYDPRAPFSLRSEPSFARRLADDAATTEAADDRPIRIGWLGDLDGHLAMEAGVLDVCEGALAARSSRCRSDFPRSGSGTRGSPGAGGFSTAASRPT
jgi:amidase